MFWVSQNLLSHLLVNERYKLGAFDVSILHIRTIKKGHPGLANVLFSLAKALLGRGELAAVCDEEVLFSFQHDAVHNLIHVGLGELFLVFFI